RKKLARDSEINAGGPGSGRHKEILTGLGYKFQGHVKEGKVQADLYRHPISTRQVLVHGSGAWSTKKGSMVDHGTDMGHYYNRYHLARDEQAVVRGNV